VRTEGLRRVRVWVSPSKTDYTSVWYSGVCKLIVIVTAESGEWRLKLQPGAEEAAPQRMRA